MSLRRNSIAIPALMMALALIAVGWPSISSAQDEGVLIDLHRSGARKVRVGMLPLEVVSSAPEAGETVVALSSRLVQDFLYSGVLAVDEPLPQGVVLPPDVPNEVAGEGQGPDAVVSIRLEGEQIESLSLTGRLLSPDGRTLILGKRYVIASDSYRVAVHHFADEVVRHLTGEPGIARTRVIFSRGDRRRRELYLVDYDGENLRRITRNGSINLAPRWSPDGNEICYTSYHEGRQRLLILDGSTGKSRRIADYSGLNVGACWAPDGGELAVTLSRDGDAEIYRIDPEGEIVQRLTNDPSIECSPYFDPTGQNLVFTSDRTGVPQIYVMGRDGSNRRRLSYEGRYNDSGCWSPRGDRIAYVSRIDGRFQIFTIEPDGSNVEQITFSEHGSNEDPSWAPDGRHLVISSDRAGTPDLWIVDVESGDSRRLTQGDGEDTGPSWSAAPPQPKPAESDTEEEMQ